MGLELSNQMISMGKSPLATIQETEAISSELMGLSENSRGATWGGTERIGRKRLSRRYEEV